MISSSLNMVDVVMIGQINEVSITAVGLANQLFFVLILLLFGINSGGAIFTAQFWGRKDTVSVHRATGVCLLFSLGDAKMPMRASAISLGLNTGLNAVLIFGLFGFPALGVQGAAIATVIARLLEMVIILTAIQSIEHPLKATLREYFSFTKAFARRVVVKSLPVVANEFFWALGIILMATAPLVARFFNVPPVVQQNAVYVMQVIGLVLTVKMLNALMGMWLTGVLGVVFTLYQTPLRFRRGVFCYSHAIRLSFTA